jgi:hypothetical protein
MFMAGYSGTPLPKKLGIKPNHRVGLVNAPADFDSTLGELPEAVRLQAGLRGEDPFDVIVFFAGNQAELRKRLPTLPRRLTPAGGLWVAWPKQASGVATDLSENIVRTAGLATGLVDNKICAVDETWAGLRFVIRVQDRPKKTR